MFARRSKILGLVLGLSDLAILAIAFQLAYFIRQNLPQPAFRPFFLSTGVALALLVSALGIWWAVGWVVGVYRRLDVYDPLLIIKNSLKQAALATAVLTGWMYLLKQAEISRGFILIFTGIATALLVLYRLFGRHLRSRLRQELAGYRYYVIVGAGERAVEVARMIEAGADLGNKVLAFVRERPGAQLPPQAGEQLQRSYPVHELSELPAMLRNHVVDEIIFAVAKADLEQMEEIFLQCEEEGVKTRVVVNFFPHISSEVYLEKLQAVPLLTFSSTPENEYHLFLKRAFDVALSAVFLVALAPAMAVIALLVKLTSPGPVIFSQVRCGLNGRRFRLLKFRSMFQGADERRSEVAHLNELDGPVFKISRDPRVTPLGRILRRLSIDEWPQLWNILKGEMSFVGPRPPLPDEVTHYEPWQRRRLRMKPGLTCLWAVEGRNTLDFARWMRLDLDYIEQWSLLLDLKILFRTIPRVLSGKGAS
jgi:exopolysaccharide biosynthesis polyprenyl glycosylphosphotransferase